MSSPVSTCAKVAGWIVLADAMARYGQSGWFHQTIASLPPTVAMTTKIVLGLGCAASLAMGGLALWSLPTAVRPAKPQGLAQSQDVPHQH